MKRDKDLKWKPPFYADGRIIRDSDHEIVVELRGLSHLLTLPDGDMIVEKRVQFITESLNNEYVSQ